MTTYSRKYKTAKKSGSKKGKSGRRGLSGGVNQHSKKYKCVRCEATSKSTGMRCKNKVTCIKGCEKYCWQHSSGYKKKTNSVCKGRRKRTSKSRTRSRSRSRSRTRKRSRSRSRTRKR